MNATHLVDNSFKLMPFVTPTLRSWASLRLALRTPRKLAHQVELQFFRHAETRTNALGLVTGSQDPQLSDHGRAQALNLGRQLESHYDAAFCSGLIRSRTTLELALKTAHISMPAYLDSRLNERSLGALELQPARMIPEYAIGDLAYAPPGVESYLEVSRRVLSFLLDLMRWSEQTNATRILISGHMGPFRILCGTILEERDPITVLAFTVPNAKVVRIPWNRLVWPPFLRDME